ncbi:uncharacterized protein LOC131327828 [Rhododendron vialii]|uniref:uncharacterized protein LOC131327828 n=1 Tax=Rhododendron vialii TaxID=182163 RepID=UPI00265EA226|nr:uncharacterized protein LOC131327828 [Rhododendron vialii]
MKKTAAATGNLELTRNDWKTMSNYTKLDFTVLDISGMNYLSWILDVEIHLNAMELRNTITDGNDASLKDHAKAMIFIRHHLHEDLKSEYLTVKDPLSLWNNLKESEYNSTLFKIVSILKLCGEQQYRERGFEKYSDLISYLLVAEQNNELLLRNHESRPTGALPFPEANRISFPSNGQDRGRGRRRGRGSHNHQVRGGYIQKSGKKPEYPHKWNKSEVSKAKGKRVLNNPLRTLRILATDAVGRVIGRVLIVRQSI